jgi:hypothetical protein
MPLSKEALELAKTVEPEFQIAWVRLGSSKD